MLPKKARSLVSPDGKSIYIGVNHNTDFGLPRSVQDRVLDTGEAYGFWYEGNGGDADKVKKVLGNIKYDGSWDTLLNSKSPAFYYVLFSNSKKGTADLITKLKDPSKTILEVLSAAGDKVAHEALKGSTSKEKLIEFLQECSPALLQFATQTAATKQALKEFFAKGEALMWPSNWRSGPTAASRVALKANKARLEVILKRKGVFFLGEDHLQTLKAMDPNLKFLTEASSNGD